MTFARILSPQKTLDVEHLLHIDDGAIEGTAALLVDKIDLRLDIERLVNVLKRRWDNDDNLPIGFARSPGLKNSLPGPPLPDQIGLTCAACHTGELRRKGAALRIDGGAGMISVEKFQTALAIAILQTAESAASPTMPGKKRFLNFVNRLTEISIEKKRSKVPTPKEIGEGFGKLARIMVGAVAVETQEFFKRRMARHKQGDFSENYSIVDYVHTAVRVSGDR